ncbi:hypothetical protein BDV23DRAFT_145257 [Aspergillus alliaceus]|uniref:Uncharacterized protein n=1 Tax=Petromyces alliaceus TaxID=209559 RepID=A0A5N7CMX4_PETAA|nr:hypothetical protein BDV23DRAFT_145257 [Aspergillus alliaceus]
MYRKLSRLGAMMSSSGEKLAIRSWNSIHNQQATSVPRSSPRDPTMGKSPSQFSAQ